jgi:hypothetical protein
MKSDSGKLLFRGYMVLLLAMILMFGMGAMPLASGMADDDPVASSDGVFSNTCDYDNSAWADEAEGREDRQNNPSRLATENPSVRMHEADRAPAAYIPSCATRCPTSAFCSRTASHIGKCNMARVGSGH